MEKLKKELMEILSNPFKELTLDDISGIQNRCNDIAGLLFDNFCIKCENNTFRFAEIEFYYYKKSEQNQNNFDAPWNKETYPRDKNAGELFFHYSGVDICFQCNFDEKEKDNEYGEFGGILIRSLRYENNILAGPLFCSNAILNACKEKMPKIEPTNNQKCELGKTLRYGIPSDKKQNQGKELFLCFFATHVNNVELKWERTSERISWDKTNEKFKRSFRNYNNERHLL